MGLRVWAVAVLVSLVSAQSSCNVRVTPPGGSCPITYIDSRFVANASVGVVGPGVAGGCEVLSRTEFRATVRGVSAPTPYPGSARISVIGANYNGAPCSVTAPWFPNSPFSASTLPCATPGGGTYYGDIVLGFPVLSFTVRSAF